MAPVPGILPIKGESGRVRTGSGATAADARWVGEWDVEISQDKTEVGPFVGDGNKYPLGSGRSATFSIKGNIPKGGDPAIRALRKRANGTTTATVEIMLEAFGGDWFKFADPFIEKYKSSQKGDGSHEFECSGSGIVIDGDSSSDEE